jgi:hypothetical protein
VSFLSDPRVPRDQPLQNYASCRPHIPSVDLDEGQGIGTVDAPHYRGPNDLADQLPRLPLHSVSEARRAERNGG